MGRLAYVYIVFRPNGVPLYVGKGSGERLGRHAARAQSNPHYGAVLKQAGGKLPVAVVARGLTDREAYALEKLLTWAIGIESEGGPLVNGGHGGQGGPSGVKRSKEFRANRRVKAIEAWQDETFRAKMLRPDRLRYRNTSPRSEAFKAAVSKTMMGNTHTLGFNHSEESKALMRERWADPEWREREMERRRLEQDYSGNAKKGWVTRKANIAKRNA